MTSNIADRLQWLEDRNAIQDLELRYATAIDLKQLDALDEVFATDAQFIYQDFGEFTGLDAFKALINENAKFLDATHHMVMNTSISVQGDTAKCYCYVQAQHIRHELDPAFMLLMGGNYSDKLRRIDGCWRVIERNMHTLWGIGNPAVLNLPADTPFIQKLS